MTKFAKCCPGRCPEAQIVKMKLIRCRYTKVRAVSSAGRAPGLHPGGRQFEPVTAHHSETHARGAMNVESPMMLHHVQKVMAGEYEVPYRATRPAILDIGANVGSFA